MYLLCTFVCNLLLYLVRYLLLKCQQHGERLAPSLRLLALTSLLTWLTALYFLVFYTSIAPGIAPALSRESAKRCVVDGVFDGHDAWHFLSAVALGLTGYLVMVLDSGAADVYTVNMPVF